MPDLCPTCNTPLKPLFQTFFCPNDCDRPGGGPKRKEEETTGEWWRQIVPGIWKFVPGGSHISMIGSPCAIHCCPGKVTAIDSNSYYAYAKNGSDYCHGFYFQ